MNFVQRMIERQRAQKNAIITKLAASAARQELKLLYSDFDLSNKDHYKHYNDEYFYKLRHFNNIFN